MTSLKQPQAEDMNRLMDERCEAFGHQKNTEVNQCQRNMPVRKGLNLCKR